MSSLRDRNPSVGESPCALTGDARPPGPPLSGPRVRVSALITVEHKVLLVRQRRGDSAYWLLPGGGVERGESLETALAREVYEECGLRARRSGPPLALVQTISPDGGRSRHLLQIVLPAEIASSTPALPATDEPAAGTDEAVLEVAWFDRFAVPRLVLHPPIQDLLAAWLDPVSGLEAAPPPPCVITGPLWAPE